MTSPTPPCVAVLHGPQRADQQELRTQHRRRRARSSRSRARTSSRRVRCQIDHGRNRSPRAGSGRSAQCVRGSRSPPPSHDDHLPPPGTSSPVAFKPSRRNREPDASTRTAQHQKVALHPRPASRAERDIKPQHVRTPIAPSGREWYDESRLLGPRTAPRSSSTHCRPRRHRNTSNINARAANLAAQRRRMRPRLTRHGSGHGLRHRRWKPDGVCSRTLLPAMPIHRTRRDAAVPLRLLSFSWPSFRPRGPRRLRRWPRRTTPRSPRSRPAAKREATYSAGSGPPPRCSRLG